MTIIRISRDARILRELLFDFIKDLPQSFPSTIDYQPTTVRVSGLEADENYRLSLVTLDWQSVKVIATIAIHPKNDAYPRGKRTIREVKLIKGKNSRTFDASAVAHLPPW